LRKPILLCNTSSYQQSNYPECKYILPCHIDYNILGDVGLGNEFNPNGFWNYQALRALERLIDDYNSGYYEEEGGAPAHIELIKTLTKEELIKICKLTARKIGDLDDNCYDSISESAMDNLEIILRRELENPNRLTANILPEAKDKLILKENMSDLEEIGNLPEFSNEGFYNQLALSAVTHLLNKIKDGDFDIVDDKDEIIIAVLPSLNKQELIEIIKEASNGISSIPDDAYDYMFDEAYESVQEILVKKFSGKDLLSAEIIPEDK
jgi:hypothetical protein